MQYFFTLAYGDENLIINLSHYKGGVGKTTLAINLAIALKAPILDLDGQQSSVLFNKLRKVKGSKPIDCFTAETEDELKDIFQQFTSPDKLLVVDSGGYDSNINRFAILAADMLITPVAPSQVELFALQKYSSILSSISDTYGQPFKTNVVINNADIRSKAAIIQLKHFIQTNNTYLDLFSTIIHCRSDYKRAYSEGSSVIELDAHSKASFELNQLVKEIKREL
ncbi:MAG: plasmid partitioning protein [Firmicutes bacterium]|nr:plasmid partitioning protein [Bacillota bacterium]